MFKSNLLFKRKMRALAAGEKVSLSQSGMPSLEKPSKMNKRTLVLKRRKIAAARRREVRKRMKEKSRMSLVKISLKLLYNNMIMPSKTVLRKRKMSACANLLLILNQRMKIVKLRVMF